MFIRSERLFLRPGWPEEWEDVLGLIGDEAVVRNLADVPWPYTAQDARSFLVLPHEQRLPQFLITVPQGAGAGIVGGVGLNRSDTVPELGYWIARDHWGRGYATEAARAVAGLARTLGHERVKAFHFVDNPASGRVLEKAGFQRTGRVTERFGKARGKACPTREYELIFAASGDCGDGDDLMGCKRAA